VGGIEVTTFMAVLLAIFSLTAPHPRDGGRTAALEAELARIASESDGTVAISVVHVESGERVGLRSGEALPMASVYKLPISIAAMAQVQSGALKRSTAIRIDPDDYRRGHSPLADRMKGRPTTITVREAIEMILVDSDNTASDALLRSVGGPERVMAELRRLGVAGVDVSRSERELGSALDDAKDENDAAAARSRFLADRRDVASADALADLLVRLYRGELLDESGTRFVLETMGRCRTGLHRLRAGIPAGVPLAHKTGTWGAIGTVNDVGIVTLPDGRGHLAIAVLVSASTRGTEADERTVAAVGRAVYAAYAPR
jgi:beta-lactamase class A